MNGAHEPLNASILTSLLAESQLLPSTGLVTQTHGENISPGNKVIPRVPRDVQAFWAMEMPSIPAYPWLIRQARGSSGDDGMCWRKLSHSSTEGFFALRRLEARMPSWVLAVITCSDYDKTLAKKRA